MKISDLTDKQLRAYLRRAVRSFGRESVTAKIIRRELDLRTEADRAAKILNPKIGLMEGRA
ncbi:MAG TPA: hypothetical protein VMG59_06850 [Phycisphaerae bacterium]|nr:hypothetical protein [Phycisphaerae bacterium]